MPKADFVTSIILFVFGIAIFVLSLRMPHLQEFGVNPYSVPGIVPGMLGVIITILSLVLFVRSIHQEGHRLQLTRAKALAFFQDTAYRRVLLTVFLGIVYGIGFLGRIPYVLATILYVGAFVILFEYQRDKPFHEQKSIILWGCIQAVLVAGIVAAVFRYVFLVDLP